MMDIRPIMTRNLVKRLLQIGLEVPVEVIDVEFIYHPYPEIFIHLVHNEQLESVLNFMAIKHNLDIIIEEDRIIIGGI